MTLFCSQNLVQAIQRLIEDIGLQTDATIEVIELARLEDTARGLCGQLKAMQALDVQNARAAASETEKTYTEYEDLPPLRPEERARLEQKFIALLAPEDSGGDGDEPPRVPVKAGTRH